LEHIARVMTFRDVVSMVMGNSISYARLQTPLREFLQRRITNNGEMTIDAALLKLLDENFAVIEESVGVANVKDDVDLSETLHFFLEERILELARCIQDAPEDQVKLNKSRLDCFVLREDGK
jgi:hypothetical protein